MLVICILLQAISTLNSFHLRLRSLRTPSSSSPAPAMAGFTFGTQKTVRRFVFSMETTRIQCSVSRSVEAGLAGKTDSLFSFQFNPKYMMMASACSVMSFWLPTIEDEV